MSLIQFNFDGVDCVWAAVDNKGHVAAFLTAGKGPLPRALVENAICVEDIEAELLSSDITGGARLLIDVPRPDDFVNLASRGLYVFDWRDAVRTRMDESNRYELVATPETPMVLDEKSGFSLPSAHLLINRNTDFSVIEWVDAERMSEFVKSQ